VNGETYDAMRVEVLKKDEYGVRVPFGDDAIEVSVKGPIALMGPRLLSLSGGGTSLFVRSLPVEKPSKATLTVRSEEEEISLQIEVR
jgi:beta-galactosidase